MATPDQRKSIFDLTPTELAQVSKGDRVSADGWNAVVDTVNSHIAGVSPGEQVDPPKTTGVQQLAIVRGWPAANGDKLDVTYVTRADDAWVLRADETVEVLTDRGMPAVWYDSVRWMDATVTYPYVLPRSVLLGAMPVVRIAGERVMQWAPLLFPPDVSLDNLPSTDGYSIDGEGEVGFAVNP